MWRARRRVRCLRRGQIATAPQGSSLLPGEIEPVSLCTSDGASYSPLVSCRAGFARIVKHIFEILGSLFLFSGESGSLRGRGYALTALVIGKYSTVRARVRRNSPKRVSLPAEPRPTGQLSSRTNDGASGREPAPRPRRIRSYSRSGLIIRGLQQGTDNANRFGILCPTVRRAPSAQSAVTSLTASDELATLSGAIASRPYASASVTR